jgi:hypothetical protein
MAFPPLRRGSILRDTRFTKSGQEPTLTENITLSKPTLCETEPTLSKNNLQTSGWTHVI